MLNGLGWVATALFAASYFCKTSRAMRRVQASAALLWVGYGIWINALPIIVANVIVGALALYSDWRLLRLSVCERKKAARLESIEEIQNLNVTHEVT